MTVADATVCRYRDGRILQADLRETRAVSRQLAMNPPETCWTFGGWCNWPFGSNPGPGYRIRHMCTHALIYPCAWYDLTEGWHYNTTEHAARLDTLKPTMGHETSVPSGGGSWFTGGVTPRVVGDGPGLPAEWPWVDTCNGCWNFSSHQWFSGAPSDWNFNDRAFQLLELMQSTDAPRRLRKGGFPTAPTYYYGAPAMDWPCFAAQVAPGALVSLALTIEIYKSQNKTTRAYGSVVNIYVTGNVSVRVPLLEIPS